MPNPLFDRRRQPAPMQGGGIFDSVFNQVYQSNPQFRDFANSMRGKTMEQACRENGVDPAQLFEAKKNPQRFLSQFGMFGQ